MRLVQVLCNGVLQLILALGVNLSPLSSSYLRGTHRVGNFFVLQASSLCRSPADCYLPSFLSSKKSCAEYKGRDSSSGSRSMRVAVALAMLPNVTSTSSGLRSLETCTSECVAE